MYSFHGSFEGSIDWLIVRLIDRLIDWLIGSWFIDWLIDRLVAPLFGIEFAGMYFFIIYPWSRSRWSVALTIRWTEIWTLWKSVKFVCPRSRKSAVSSSDNWVPWISPVRLPRTSITSGRRPLPFWTELTKYGFFPAKFAVVCKLFFFHHGISFLLGFLGFFSGNPTTRSKKPPRSTRVARWTAALRIAAMTATLSVSRPFLEHFLCPRTRALSWPDRSDSSSVISGPLYLWFSGPLSVIFWSSFCVISGPLSVWFSGFHDRLMCQLFLNDHFHPSLP